MNSQKKVGGLRYHSPCCSLLLLFVLVFFLGCKPEVSSYKEVQREPFRLIITETGELQAVDTYSFILPRYGSRWYRMNVSWILEHGTRVEKGDSVVQMDGAEIQKYILDNETSYQKELAALEKLKVEQEIARNNQEAELNSQKASFRLSEIELESASFGTKNEQAMKALEFEKARIGLEKAERKIIQQKIQQANVLKIQKIRVEQIALELKQAKSLIPLLTFRSPLSGVFLVGKDRYSGNSVRAGDQVFYGTLLGSVPDMKWMKVITTVNETDIEKVKVGLPVKVKLDALDGVYFDGEISFISKLCHKVESNSRRKVFDVIVSMKTSDLRLKPGMTVSCDFICADLKDATLVDNDCLLIRNNKAYVYFVKGTKFIEHEVKIGLRNTHQTQILTPIPEGQKICLLPRLTSLDKE